MAVIKLKSGNFQARLAGPDGKIYTQVFPSKLEAQEQVLKWKKQKKTGKLSSNSVRYVTMNDYFAEWFTDCSQEKNIRDDSGWRKIQYRQYKNYIESEIGRAKIQQVSPVMIKRILNNIAQQGRSAQLQRHVYVLLRKMFSDAIETYRYITFNPVLGAFRPLLPEKEAKHLNITQLKTLLSHVESRPYGLAIWIQLFLGLRVGELQGLSWEDVDLECGRVTIRRTYVNKTKTLREYPKGRRQHTHSIPNELLKKLRLENKVKQSSFLVHSPASSSWVLPHKGYLNTLKGYCKELDIPEIGTHGLRHSTSELYLQHGASRDDLQKLFAHSSMVVTDRYVHNHGTNLERVSKQVSLFGGDDRNKGRKKSTTKIDHDTPQVKLSELFFDC